MIIIFLPLFVNSEQCPYLQLNCQPFTFELTVQKDCLGSKEISLRYLNSPLYIFENKCTFNEVGGENMLIYDFDECGSKPPTVTETHIIYSGKIHYDIGVSNNIRADTGYIVSFSCKISSSSSVSAGRVTVGPPENGGKQIKPAGSNITIIVASDEEELPVIVALPENELITVSSNHKVSVEIDVKKQIANEELDVVQKRVCDEMENKWSSDNGDVSSCSLKIDDVTGATSLLMEIQSSVTSENNKNDIRNSIQIEGTKKGQAFLFTVCETLQVLNGNNDLCQDVTNNELSISRGEVKLTQISNVFNQPTPTPSPNTVWKYWWIPFLVALLVLLIIIGFLIRRRRRRRQDE